MDMPAIAFSLLILVVALLGALADLYGSDTRPGFSTLDQDV